MDKEQADILIPFPTVIRVERQEAGSVTVGDMALIRFPTTWLRLFMAKDTDGMRIDEGCPIEYLTVTAAAMEACYAVLMPPGTVPKVAWPAAKLSLQWQRSPTEKEGLLAKAHVKTLGHHSITIENTISTEATGEEIATIEGIYVAVTSSGTVPLPHTPTLAYKLKNKRRWIGWILPWGWQEWLRELRKSRLYKAIFRFPRKDMFIPFQWRSLLTRLGIDTHHGVRLRIIQNPSPLAIGHTQPVEFVVENFSHTSYAKLRLEVQLPSGHGLQWTWESDPIFPLDVGTARHFWGALTALRPHEVNLGRPWRCSLRVFLENTLLDELTLEVEVPDHRKGRILYVLTCDCETFDGGVKTGNYGDLASLGNQNQFMDPEEYLIHMIEKPRALNALAEKHNACWTHFWTVPQRFAAVWAAQQSSTGAWVKIVNQLDSFVRDASIRHEIAPHIHFDYEPDSQLPPQPRLIYDPHTDGIIPNEYYDPNTNPNHRWHGWDGDGKGVTYVKSLGNLTILDSKIGSMRKYLRYLSRMAAGGIIPRSTRTGACDFGIHPQSVQSSTQSLLANGILANADAGIYRNFDNHPRGRMIYFCANNDIEQEVSSLDQAALVQIRGSSISLYNQSLEQLNQWAALQIMRYQGPGVHVLVGLTDSMWVKGEPDPFRSLEGGDFSKIEQHIEFVRKRYPYVEFVTATEATYAFLDYYTPEPKAVVNRLISISDDAQRLVCSILILGRDIPINPTQPASLSVQVPPFVDPDEIRTIEIQYYGNTIAVKEGPFSTNELPTIEFSAVDHDGYTMVLKVTPDWLQRINYSSSEEIKKRIALCDNQTHPQAQLEFRRPRLLSSPKENANQPYASWVWQIPNSLFTILANPVGGKPYPLGKGLHIYGLFLVAAAKWVVEHSIPNSSDPMSLEIIFDQPSLGRKDFYYECVLKTFTDESFEASFNVREGNSPVAHGLIAGKRTIK